MAVRRRAPGGRRRQTDSLKGGEILTIDAGTLVTDAFDGFGTLITTAVPGLLTIGILVFGIRYLWRFAKGLVS